MKSLDYSLKKRYRVERSHLASYVGSGSVDVLSTPSLISFMEDACKTLAEMFIEQSKVTVGTHIDVYHVSPAMLGDEVEIEAKVLSIKGKKLEFFIQAWSGNTLIGYGIHERAVVEPSRFKSEGRVINKSNS
ncbi:MAG: thioesterase [Desulfurococcales archaeon]|nr:thioesterase [Desulfurococcales archaeon]